MSKFTFAWYPMMPAACEGDDPVTRSFSLRLRDESRVLQMISALEKRYGGYVQLWERS